MLDGSILYLLLGIVIGILLTAKSAKEVLSNLPEAVVPYTMLGLMLSDDLTAAIGWAAFTCVVVAFLFYHAIGREGWNARSTKIPDIRQDAR